MQENIFNRSTSKIHSTIGLFPINVYTNCFVFIIALLLMPNYCNSKTIIREFWMPKNYIDSLKIYKDENRCENLLFPIECIMINGFEIFIKSKGSDFFPVNVIDINDNYNNYKRKVLIKELTFNLSDENFLIFKNAKYHLTLYDSELILEIYYNNKIDTIIFTNNIDTNSKIDLPFITKLKILMHGAYKCYDKDENILEDSIVFDYSNFISNSLLFNSYKFGYFNATVENDKTNMYNIITLENTNENYNSSYMFNMDKNKNIYMYEYKLIYGTGYYVGDIVFRFQRYSR